MIDGIKLRQEVAENTAKSLLAVDQAQIDSIVDAIIKAKRIYVAGWGRAGNMIRILSMNCSQLGLKTHIVGDNSTPSIHEGDLLIIGSGSGETDTMKILADQAKEHGADLAVITHGAESYIAKKADIVVVVPTLYTGDVREQPVAITLVYYQAAFMLNDCIYSQIADRLGVTFDDIIRNHNNLE